MVNILIWHGKYDPCYYDASTPQKEAKAWLSVFKDMQDFGMYSDLEPKYLDELKQEASKLKISTELDENLKLSDALKKTLAAEKSKLKSLNRDIAALEEDLETYQAACDGDWKKARELIKNRSHGEYARVEEINIL